MKIRHEVIFQNELFSWRGFRSEPISINQLIPFVFLGFILRVCSKHYSTLQWIGVFVGNLGEFGVRWQMWDRCLIKNELSLLND
jgi:hypothetical protein